MKAGACVLVWRTARSVFPFLPFFILSAKVKCDVFLSFLSFLSLFLFVGKGEM